MTFEVLCIDDAFSCDCALFLPLALGIRQSLPSGRSYRPTCPFLYACGIGLLLAIVTGEHTIFRRHTLPLEAALAYPNTALESRRRGIEQNVVDVSSLDG